MLSAIKQTSLYVQRACAIPNQAAAAGAADTAEAPHTEEAADTASGAAAVNSSAAFFDNRTLPSAYKSQHASI